MGWLKQTLTGADNQTFAIGRVLGALGFLVLIVAVPIVVVWATYRKEVPVLDWQNLLASLGIYVPLIIAAIGGLIWGTNFTEPKHPAPGADAGNNP